MLQTNVLIEIIKDRLDDLRLAGQLSSVIFKKKTTDGKLLTAINQADIEVCSDLKPRGQVAVFVPQGSRVLFLEHQHIHKGSHIKAVQEGSDSAHGNALNYANQIRDEFYLDISEIQSSTAEVYDSYPDYTSGSSVPFISSTLAHRSAGNSLIHEPDRKILRVRIPFERDVFLVFDAVIRPATIPFDAYDTPNDLKETVRKYRLRAPDYAREWLIQQTLRELIPADTQAAVNVAARLEAERIKALERKPGRPNTVYVPEGSW